MNVGSLFSGIGGLDLGLERAGMQVVWQSEIDPYATRVLAKHWPTVPNLGDITTVDWTTVERPDLICGGYPCQPFSLAGTRNGADDPRHLWPHFHRAIRRLRPRYALLENVPGHLTLGFDRVLADLAEIGYDTEWFCLPAAAVGAPHLRWRLFVVATHADGEGQPELAVDAVEGPRIMVPDAEDTARWRGTLRGSSRDGRSGVDGPVGDVADTDGTPRRSTRRASEALLGPGTVERLGRCRSGDGDHWAVEPDVGRVAHGIPHRVDRLRCLGNAVVPQVAEWIGNLIMNNHNRNPLLEVEG